MIVEVKEEKKEFKPIEIKIVLTNEKELITLLSALNASVRSVEANCPDGCDGTLVDGSGFPLFQALERLAIDLGFKR